MKQKVFAAVKLAITLVLFVYIFFKNRTDSQQLAALETEFS
jgi:hypothetical protein